jgi:hypothetical protein
MTRRFSPCPDGGVRIARASVILLCLALSLAGCGQRHAAAGNAAAAAPAANVAAAPAPREAAPAPPACAPAPALGLADDFADPGHAFAPGAPAFHRVEANFAAAYRMACAHGLLRRRALIAAGAGERDRLLLKNAPDANVASIYLEGGEGAPAARRHMVLEYHFLTAEGAVDVPSTNDLGEAIFCEVQGASQQEEDTSGRCLPD